MSILNEERPSPFIIGLPSTEIDDKFRSLVHRLRPAGFILFKRNIENPEQLKHLCAELRVLCPFSPPLIFIDQEGGRVKRINWSEDDYCYPSARQIGGLYEKDTDLGLEIARLNGYVLGAELSEHGITVDCAPVADVYNEDASDIIGDRSFSSNPVEVSALCAATISGLMAGGVWPVLKHAPGHGRANADSHVALPVVETDSSEILHSDLEPFEVNNDCPFVMTAHVKYPAWDNENPATQSPKIIKDVLKGNYVNLKGLIVADDITMGALSGSLAERAQKSLEAGCDLILYCSGNLDGTADSSVFEKLEELIGVAEMSKEAIEKVHNLPHLTSRKEHYHVHDAKSRVMRVLEEYGQL